MIWVKDPESTFGQNRYQLIDNEGNEVVNLYQDEIDQLLELLQEDDT